VPKEDPGDDVKVEILFGEPILVAAGLNSRWARRRRIGLAELVDEAWILPPRDNLVGQLVAEFFHVRGLPYPKNGVCGGLQLNDSLIATARYLGFYSRWADTDVPRLY